MKKLKKSDDNEEIRKIILQGKFDDEKSSTIKDFAADVAFSIHVFDYLSIGGASIKEQLNI